MKFDFWHRVLVCIYISRYMISGMEHYFKAILPSAKLGYWFICHSLFVIIKCGDYWKNVLII